MKIVKRIDVIPTQEFSPDIGGAGHVAFVTDTGDLVFECKIKPGRGPDTRNPKLALITDAMRQVAMLPEYRISKSYMKFAPGVLPDELAA